MKIIFSLLISLTAASYLYAQESDTLTTRYKVLSKGNIFITGNNILNRKEGKADANTPYNDLIGGLKLNDSQVMEYIDVDKDKKTFSSSTANVSLPKNSKILFAGLYWAATYPYEQGQVVAQKSVAKDAKRESVEEVLLKMPKEKYIPVKGEYVFDGNTDSRYMGKNAPYIMFADVTKLVQNNKRIDGEYTVANIRAARGSVVGGSCAGWTLVIAYENSSDPFRKLDIKDGFIEVKGNKNIVFSNYKIPSVKEAFPRLVGAVLDADFNQGENQVGVFSDKVGFYLETKTRKIKNFFNSSITYAEDYNKQRKPNSKNTLGFDIFSVELPNYDFEVFPVGNEYLRVNLSSTSDSYYAFLMGLAINTEESTSLRDEEVDRLLGKKTTPKPVPTGQTVVNANQTPTTSQGQNTTQVATNTGVKATSQTNTNQTNATSGTKTPVQQTTTGQTATTGQVGQTATAGQTEQIPDNVRRITSASVKKGFYLILGVYSSKENAEKYMFGLRQKGMRAEGSFFYTEKNLYYAYSLYAPTYAEAFKKQQEINTARSLNPDLQKVKDVWILYVE
nr:SPOR domain-containing protein [uncultured Capnocytophaga sp.]